MALEWIDDPKFIRKILSKEELGELRDLVRLLRKQNRELRDKLEKLEMEKKPICSHHFP